MRSANIPVPPWTLCCRHGQSVTHLKIPDLIAVTSFLPRCRMKLKEHMQYCIDHPDEISKLAKVQKKVSETKGVMIKNIEKAVET
ncbi:Vesicle-associated membrane protein [Arachis hypogaea]|nr:Vesicle-associated membrane protein [Arachis hypogaea]